MKIKQCLMIIFFLVGSNISAQSLNFEKNYNGYALNGSDRGYAVQQIEDDGYIIGGTALIKIDKYGDTLWTRDIEGTAIHTNDGGYVIASWFEGIKKVSSDGNILWSKSYDSQSLDDLMEISSIVQTNDNGYVMCGMGYNSSISESIGAYIVKTDVDGNIVWKKLYQRSPQISSRDHLNNVVQTDDGGYILVGLSEVEIIPQHRHNVYLMKTDINGDILWTKEYEILGNDFGYSVKQTSDGGYIICGSASEDVGSSKAFLIKTDYSGEVLWTKSYGTTGQTLGHSVFQTSDGGYIIGGSTDNFGSWDIYLIKTTDNGDMLWTKSHGTSAEEAMYGLAQGFALTSDGGYIVTGYTKFGLIAQQSDIYVVKTDSLGIVSDNTVGFEDVIVKKSDVSLSPNPFSSQTTLYTNTLLKNATVTVYNSFGQIVKQINNIFGNTAVLHRTNLPEGLYFILLEEGDKIIASEKIVIMD